MTPCVGQTRYLYSKALHVKASHEALVARRPMQAGLTADSCEPLWDLQHAVQHREAARHAQENQGPGQAGSRGLLGAAGQHQ